MVWFLKQYCQTSIADRIPTTLHIRIPSNDFQGRIARWDSLDPSEKSCPETGLHTMHIMEINYSLILPS